MKLLSLLVITLLSSNGHTLPYPQDKEQEITQRQSTEINMRAYHPFSALEVCDFPHKQSRKSPFNSNKKNKNPQPTIYRLPSLNPILQNFYIHKTSNINIGFLTVHGAIFFTFSASLYLIILSYGEDQPRSLLKKLCKKMKKCKKYILYQGNNPQKTDHEEKIAPLKHFDQKEAYNITNPNNGSEKKTKARKVQHLTTRSFYTPQQIIPEDEKNMIIISEETKKNVQQEGTAFTPPVFYDDHFSTLDHGGTEV